MRPLWVNNNITALKPEPNPPASFASSHCMHSSTLVQYQWRTVTNHPVLPVFFLLCSGREARNRAEKNRRDKLNGSIQELSTMVPHVAESPRRVDKTAVLRFAAHGLRLQHGE